MATPKRKLWIRSIIPMLSLVGFMALFFQNCAGVGGEVEDENTTANKSSLSDSKIPVTKNPNDVLTGKDDPVGDYDGDDKPGKDDKDGDDDDDKPGYYDDGFAAKPLYPVKPTGSSFLASQRWAVNNPGTLSKDNLIWGIYAKTVNQSGVSIKNERQRHVVVSFKVKSSNSNTVTHTLSGTSLCYSFSATVVASKAMVKYMVQHGGKDGSPTYASGYTTKVSGLKFTAKTKKQMRMFEDNMCKGFLSMDKTAINNFINQLKYYSVPSGSKKVFFGAQGYNKGIQFDAF